MAAVQPVSVPTATTQPSSVPTVPLAAAQPISVPTLQPAWGQDLPTGTAPQRMGTVGTAAAEQRLHGPSARLEGFLGFQGKAWVRVHALHSTATPTSTRSAAVQDAPRTAAPAAAGQPGTRAAAGSAEPACARLLGQQACLPSAPNTSAVLWDLEETLLKQNYKKGMKNRTFMPFTTC